MDAQENVYMRWHLFKVNAHSLRSGRTKQGLPLLTNTQDLKASWLQGFCYLSYIVFFQRFLQCLLGFIVVYCIVL